MTTLTGRTVYVRYSREPAVRQQDADTDRADVRIRVDLDVDGQIVGVEHAGMIAIEIETADGDR